MPINTDALKESLDGNKAGKAKRPKPNLEKQQEQLSQLGHQTGNTISALTQGNVSAIHAQVSALDAKLTQFERETARAVAERLRQSQLRIQRYLVEELSADSLQPTDLAVLVEEVLEVPDLTSEFLLAIAPTSVAGCLPI